MTITTITTHVEPAEAASLDAVLALPLALAAAHRALLNALVFPIEMSFVAEPAASADLEARATAAIAHVQSMAARHDVASDVRGRSSFAYGAGEVLADQLRVSDLGVLCLRDAPSTAMRMALDAALFDSGRPLLLAPAGAPSDTEPERIVIAWDATPAAVRAAHAAIPFLRGTAETRVITVTGEKEIRAGQSGIELTHLLARHGARASFANVPRAGRSVLDVLAAECGHNGWLVMGAVRHSPLRRMVFGSATRGLFANAPPLPVLTCA